MKKRRKKKGSLSWWKEKCWKKFSEYVRLRDAIHTTGTDHTLICFTCGKHYPAFGQGCAQAGHYVPGRSHAVLFEEHGVHGQCYNCNVNLKGNILNYQAEMTKKYGVDETVRIEMTRFNHTFKYSTSDLEEMYNRFCEKVEELRSQI